MAKFLKKLFGGGKKETPPAPPPAPTIDTAAEEAEKGRIVRRTGIRRSKTIFTSPLGLQSAADLLKRVLGS